MNKASTDHPVHDLIAARWSPYAFEDHAVTADDIRSLFEAARWAPSGHNEQPWSYIVATKDNPEEFQRLLSCLKEGNQVWAKDVPLLVLCVVKLRFSRNDKPNRTAYHDLGLASASLCLEATSRGLAVHQMSGILPDRAREIFGIPEGYEALTGMAIGYPARPEDIPESLRTRDLKRRPRKPIGEFVFSGIWGKASGSV